LRGLLAARELAYAVLPKNLTVLAHLATEGNVELTGNEARAARVHGSSFYLCVVAGIPDAPALYLVRNPDQVGERDKLTIRAADWKRECIDRATHAED